MVTDEQSTDCRQGWVCSGCGKHVTGSTPGERCVDCGAPFVTATPERLACGNCGEEDASRVFNSEYSRLCGPCILKENADTKLDAEARALVTIFNDAKADYSPELEWFGMSHDREAGQERFVLEAEKYIDEDGLAALRDAGREVAYIEGYEYDGEVGVQIAVPVADEVPRGVPTDA